MPDADWHLSVWGAAPTSRAPPAAGWLTGKRHPTPSLTEPCEQDVPVDKNPVGSANPCTISRQRPARYNGVWLSTPRRRRQCSWRTVELLRPHL